MDVLVPIAGGSQQKISPYDAPSHSQDDPQAKARQVAKDEAAHPFIHYLAQFVPGLVPKQGPTAERVSGFAAESVPVNALGEPDKAPPKPLTPRHDDLGKDGLWAAVALPSPLTIPLMPVDPQPADQDEKLASVAFRPVPRQVDLQVQRLPGSGAPQIRVQVTPPNLGKLDLAFTYQEQKVSVNIVVASAEAKDHLEGKLGAIRDILHESNLESGTLKVVLGGKTGPQGGAMDRDNNGGGGSNPGGGNAAPGQALRRRKRPSLDEDLSIS